MIYEGNVSAIGDATTRKNEITVGSLAQSRYFITDVEHGILGQDSFVCTKLDASRVKIGRGLAIAYGYLGGELEETNFSFLIPSNTQYNIIYAEINLSNLPNEFWLKSRNNQSSPNITERTFRRDVLSSVRTGVFQFPLWKIKITSSGIEEITDVREVVTAPNMVKQTRQITKTIDGLATVAENPTLTDKSQKIATTYFVYTNIKNAINI